MGQDCCGVDSTQVMGGQRLPMMPPKKGVPPINIEYFDTHGRALQLKMAAWYCNVEYTTTRRNSAEFNDMKKDGRYRFNVMPSINFMDGSQMGQT